MNSQKRIRKQKLGDVVLTILIIIIMIFGIWKVAELVKDRFDEDEPEISRKVSILESVEVASKMNKTYKPVAIIEYKSSYLKDFKEVDIPLNKDEQEFLYILSKDYKISYPLLLGLIDLESSFNRDEISSTNDYGLMQINAVNHEWLKRNLEFNDILDPYNNIRSGTFILSQLFNKYNGDETKVLMVYNMGEGGAKKLWDRGVNESAYSRKVLEKKIKYEKLLK